jgi:hypothetical protein
VVFGDQVSGDWSGLAGANGSPVDLHHGHEFGGSAGQEALVPIE